MKIDGRCHCGYITFEAVIESDKTLQLYGLPDILRLCIPRARLHAEDGFRLLSGEPKIYVKTADSGNSRPQAL